MNVYQAFDILGTPAPHCDQAVLHTPGECEYCDSLPQWQALRVIWGIAFTCNRPKDDEIACPSDFRRGLGQSQSWGGNTPEGY